MANDWFKCGECGTNVDAPVNGACPACGSVIKDDGTENALDEFRTNYS